MRQPDGEALTGCDVVRAANHPAVGMLDDGVATFEGREGAQCAYASDCVPEVGPGPLDPGRGAPPGPLDEAGHLG